MAKLSYLFNVVYLSSLSSLGSLVAWDVINLRGVWLLHGLLHHWLLHHGLLHHGLLHHGLLHHGLLAGLHRRVHGLLAGLHGLASSDLLVASWRLAWLAGLAGLALVVDVCGRGVLALVLTIRLVGRVECLGHSHLSSAAFGAEDHRDEAEGEADGSECPPEPSEVDGVVAPAAVLAVARVARAAIG